MKKAGSPNNAEKDPLEEFKEGIDYYFEENLMVLTAHFLQKRGYCCHNDCRNCPYRKKYEKKT